VAIDVSKIIHAVMEGSKIRESKGIIPIFGVYLSLFSVNYYNRLPRSAVMPLFKAFAIPGNGSRLSPP
jgi:hypothetical protein